MDSNKNQNNQRLGALTVSILLIAICVVLYVLAQPEEEGYNPHPIATASFNTGITQDPTMINAGMFLFRAKNYGLGDEEYAPADSTINTEEYELKCDVLDKFFNPEPKLILSLSNGMVRAFTMETKLIRRGGLATTLTEQQVRDLEAFIREQNGVLLGWFIDKFNAFAYAIDVESKLTYVDSELLASHIKSTAEDEKTRNEKLGELSFVANTKTREDGLYLSASLKRN